MEIFSPLAFIRCSEWVVTFLISVWTDMRVDFAQGSRNFLNFYAFSFDVGIQMLDESIRETDLRNIDLLCGGPAHDIDIDLECRDDHVRAVFAQFIEPHPVLEAEAGELLVIILEQVDVQGFAFLAFGEREDLVDVTARADGNDLVGIAAGLSTNVFLHGVPLGDGHLLFEEADSADVERG